MSPTPPNDARLTGQMLSIPGSTLIAVANGLCSLWWHLPPHWMQHFCVACARRFAGAELGTLRELQLYGRAAHALERRSLTAPRDVGRDAEANAPSMVPLRRRPTAIPRRDDGPLKGCCQAL